MKIIYADCFSGVSGDMFLGALMDLGIDKEWLHGELISSGLPPFTLEVSRIKKGAISCTRCRASSNESPAVHRGLDEIAAMIEGGSLPKTIKKRGITMFRFLAQVEARIHDIPVAQIHFHELGALDTMVEVLGVLLACNHLGMEALYASPLPLGHGIITTMHGPIPIPAPATLAILEGVPVIHTDLEAELVTPTGALLIKELAKGFGMHPQMTIAKVGYGAGERDLPGRPNCLRLILGETDAGSEEEYIDVLECDIDDMNPELYPHVMEILFDKGALDVTFSPIIMKKGRPGTRVSVLTGIHLTRQLSAILLEETTTLGVRIQRVLRSKAFRRIVTIQTPYGPVRVKYAWRGNTLINIAPEYEDYLQISRRYNRPVKSLYQEIVAEALKQAGNLVDNTGI